MTSDPLPKQSPITVPVCRREWWKGIAPALALFTASGVPFFVCSSLAYQVGKKEEDNRLFLRNYRSPNDYEAIIKMQMDYTLKSNEHNDVLFLGSSSCLACVRPRQFEDITGLKAYNLGFPGLIGMRGCNLALQSYLESHTKPRVVVFVLHPWELSKRDLELGPVDVRDRFVWCYGSGTENMRPPHDQGIREYVRLGILTLLGMVSGGVEGRLNETIQGHFRVGDTYNTREKQIRQRRGFAEYPDDVMAGYHRPRGTPDAPFMLISEYKDGFRVLAQTCRDNGIILLVRLSPVFVGDAPTNSDALLEWSRSLENEYPHVIVARPPLLLFERDFFWDKLHCNGLGAKMFTVRLSEEVGKALGK